MKSIYGNSADRERAAMNKPSASFLRPKDAPKGRTDPSVRKFLTPPPPTRPKNLYRTGAVVQKLLALAVLIPLLLFTACPTPSDEPDGPTVTSVEVSPANETVAPGATQQFTATVIGTNNPAQSVTWDVKQGGTETKISSDGVLTVGTNEKASSLTVLATSTVDTSKIGTASITVNVAETGNLTSIAEVQNSLSTASGGTAGSPVVLNVQLNLANDWAALLNVIQTADKFVALNLSSCTISDTEFDPGADTTGKSKIVSLSLPNTAKSIGSSSPRPFEKFTALTSVTGSAVETIGDYAFADCISLNSVNFPKATSIGNSAFTDCASLSSVTIPMAANIGDYSFQGCSALTAVNFPAAISIGSRAFSDTGLTAVDLPAATSIGNSAFKGCTALTEVSLPAATSIGSSALHGCTTIATLRLGLTSIGSSAFKGYKSLTTLILPAATSIGNSAFEDCTSLTTLSLPAATSISSSAFKGCTSLNVVSLDKTTNIGASAFEGCITLSLVSLSAATNISASAFKGCTTLKTVFLLVATSIGASAFEGCTALDTVFLPVAANIGARAFANCASLKTLSLDRATNIGSYTFEGCTSLDTLSLPAAASIGEYAFKKTSTTGLSITLGSTAPTLGIHMFSEVSASKTVTVKVPSGATGYGSLPTGTDTVCWGNGFRGAGWNGSAFLSGGEVNSNITLTEPK